VVLQLLANRDITEPGVIERFLKPNYAADLHDPFLFVDMEKATDRILRAIEKKESIVVYGDYDADGVSATAVMSSTIEALGGVVKAYIPFRETEGYGLNLKAVRELHGAGAQLVVTVDCGTSNIKEAAALKAAAALGPMIRAVVSRGGRPDLALDDLPRVQAPTLLIVGGNDDVVIELNRQAYRELRAEKELKIIPGATHLFEEPGTLEQVASAAANWFAQHLAGGAVGEGRLLALLVFQHLRHLIGRITEFAPCLRFGDPELPDFYSHRLRLPKFIPSRRIPPKGLNHGLITAGVVTKSSSRSPRQSHYIFPRIAEPALAIHNLRDQPLLRTLQGLTRGEVARGQFHQVKWRSRYGCDLFDEVIHRANQALGRFGAELPHLDRRIFTGLRHDPPHGAREDAETATRNLAVHHVSLWESLGIQHHHQVH